MDSSFQTVEAPLIQPAANVPGMTPQGNWWDHLSRDDKATFLTGIGGLATSLFLPGGNDTGINQAIAKNTQRAGVLTGQGNKLFGQGEQGLTPVLKYLTDLMSGNPGQELAATAPDRQRVIDQYDTARRSVSTAPRGGGQTGALTDLASHEASDLALQQIGARTSAVKTLGDLSSSLTNLGLGAESAGNTAADAAIQRMQEQRAAKAKRDASTGQAIGTALAIMAMFL